LKIGDLLAVERALRAGLLVESLQMRQHGAALEAPRSCQECLDGVIADRTLERGHLCWSKTPLTCILAEEALDSGVADLAL
jgi:hypothetical protein